MGQSDRRRALGSLGKFLPGRPHRAAVGRRDHFLVDSGARGAATCARHLLERSSDLATQTVTYGNNNRPLDTLQQAYDRGAYDNTPEEYAAIYELLSASSPINPNNGGSKRTF